MFKKHDTILHFMKALVDFLTGLFMIVFLVVGIVLLFRSIVLGIVIICVGEITVFVNFLICRVLFSFLYDIKLIRNKLYDIKDEKLISIINDEK